MNEEMIIDVEEIMQQIRENIKKRGETDAILSFDEAKVECKYEEGNIRIGETDLSRLISFAAGMSGTNYYAPIEGNPIKVFIKKVMRKLMSFQLVPYIVQQNNFNSSVVQSLQILAEKTNASEYEKFQKVLLDKERQIEELEARVEELESKQG